MRYERGRKDTSRTRIVEAAAQRFRNDGIAASGLAAIMGDAGLTNGAFYPHFPSKAALVRECVETALDAQSRKMGETLAEGGPKAAIEAYLSPEHRDSPGTGCASAALLPELARQAPETREVFTEHIMVQVRQLSAALAETKDPESVALGVIATMIGALQLARAVEGPDLSDRILAAGADAARALIGQRSQRI